MEPSKHASASNRIIQPGMIFLEIWLYIFLGDLFLWIDEEQINLLGDKGGKTDGESDSEDEYATYLDDDKKIWIILVAWNN